MAVPSRIVDEDGNPLKLVEFENGAYGKHYHMAIIGPSEVHGLWSAASGTTAATTVATRPPNGGNIHVQNIAVSGEKKNTGTIELRFTDGTNTITIFKAILTDAPVNIAIAGNYHGWKDARLEVITVLDFTYTVLCGYIKQPSGLRYSDWDARR